MLVTSADVVATIGRPAAEPLVIFDVFLRTGQAPVTQGKVVDVVLLTCRSVTRSGIVIGLFEFNSRPPEAECLVVAGPASVMPLISKSDVGLVCLSHAVPGHVDLSVPASVQMQSKSRPTHTLL